MNEKNDSRLKLLGDFAPKGANVVIVMHKYPDGDCLASACILQNLLSALGFPKEKIFVLNHPGSKDITFNWLRLDFQFIDKVPKNSSVYLVDHAAQGKTTLDSWKDPNIKQLFILDHHFTEEPLKDYKAIFKVDPNAPSTTWVIYHLGKHVIQTLESEVKRIIANFIFGGIYYDFARFNKGITNQVWDVFLELSLMGFRPESEECHLIGHTSYLSYEKKIGFAMQLCEKARNIGLVQVNMASPKKQYVVKYLKAFEFNYEHLYQRLFMLYEIDHIFVIEPLPDKSFLHKIIIRTKAPEVLKKFYNSNGKLDARYFGALTLEECKSFYRKLAAHVAAYEQRRRRKNENPNSIEQVQ